jgi:hypothetical protein
MRYVSLFAALAAAACSRAADSAAPAAPQSRETVPAAAESAPAPSPEAALAGAETAAPAIDLLTDRLWMLTPGDSRPGVFRIFLSSGAMIEGSCVETYRVSEWSRNEAGKIVWKEDVVDISADIVSVDDAALTLGVNLADGQKVETYAVAAAPFVCPDLPR